MTEAKNSGTRTRADKEKKEDNKLERHIINKDHPA
jgi:hypothetical protein